MEDPLAPFADLLEDDTDAVQGPFSLQEVSDYGRLYEYCSGLEDFSAWDGVFETKSIEVQSPESVLTHVADQTEPPKLAPTDDDFAHVSGSSKSRFQFSEPAEMDSKLLSEMQELLNLFQTVYENKPTIDRASLLRKCVAMCERIMERFQRLPQVVAMHEQAQALLQALETESPSAAASSSESTGSSREQLRTDVKEALDRVDREAEECEDPNEGKVVDGVYILKGIRYCKTHIDREQCEECGVDYLLLNQVHRDEDEVDTTVIKEQQRLEELELQRNSAPPHSVPETPAPDDDEDAEDFQSIAKDLNEELARARKKDEADFLKCFASFQIS